MDGRFVWGAEQAGGRAMAAPIAADRAGVNNSSMDAGRPRRSTPTADHLQLEHGYTLSRLVSSASLALCRSPAAGPARETSHNVDDPAQQQQRRRILLEQRLSAGEGDVRQQSKSPPLREQIKGRCTVGSSLSNRQTGEQSHLVLIEAGPDERSTDQRLTRIELKPNELDLAELQAGHPSMLSQTLELHTDYTPEKILIDHKDSDALKLVPPTDSRTTVNNVEAARSGVEASELLATRRRPVSVSTNRSCEDKVAASSGTGVASTTERVFVLGNYQLRLNEKLASDDHIFNKQNQRPSLQLGQFTIQEQQERTVVMSPNRLTPVVTAVSEAAANGAFDKNTQQQQQQQQKSLEPRAGSGIESGEEHDGKTVDRFGSIAAANRLGTENACGRLKATCAHTSSCTENSINLNKDLQSKPMNAVLVRHATSASTTLHVTRLHDTSMDHKVVSSTASSASALATGPTVRAVTTSASSGRSVFPLMKLQSVPSQHKQSQSFEAGTLKTVNLQLRQEGGNEGKLAAAVTAALNSNGAGVGTCLVAAQETSSAPNNGGSSIVVKGAALECLLASGAAANIVQLRPSDLAASLRCDSDIVKASSNSGSSSLATISGATLLQPAAVAPNLQLKSTELVIEKCSPTPAIARTALGHQLPTQQQQQQKSSIPQAKQETMHVLAAGGSQVATSSSSNKSFSRPADALRCAICGKQFSTTSALTKHKLTHSNERKFVCHLCSKAFKRQDHLNGHMLTHRDKKPYACDSDGCDKSYCDARSLRRHKDHHHHQMNLPQQQQSNTTSRCGTPATSGTSTVETIPATAVSTSGVSGAVGSQQPAATKITFTTASSCCSKVVEQQQPVVKHTSITLSGSGKTSIRLNNVVSCQSTATSVEQDAREDGVSATSSTASALPANCGSSVAAARPAPASTSKSTRGSVLLDLLRAGCVIDASKEKCTDADRVECTLCDRSFKNVAALNGHMRLHGGYLKRPDEHQSFTGQPASSSTSFVAVPVASSKSTKSCSVAALNDIECDVFGNSDGGTSLTDGSVTRHHRASPNQSSLTKSTVTSAFVDNTYGSVAGAGQSTQTSALSLGTPSAPPPPLSNGQVIRALLGEVISQRHRARQNGQAVALNVPIVSGQSTPLLTGLQPRPVGRAMLIAASTSAGSSVSTHTLVSGREGGAGSSLITRVAPSLAVALEPSRMRCENFSRVRSATPVDETRLASATGNAAYSNICLAGHDVADVLDSGDEPDIRDNVNTESELEGDRCNVNSIVEHCAEGGHHETHNSRIVDSETSEGGDSSYEHHSNPDGEVSSNQSISMCGETAAPLPVDEVANGVESVTFLSESSPRVVEHASPYQQSTGSLTADPSSVLSHQEMTSTEIRPGTAQSQQLLSLASNQAVVHYQHHHQQASNHRRHSDGDFLAVKSRRECRLSSDPGYALEPLFADIATLTAHREEDEDFGAFLEENPEFFVDFGDDPFEDVPSAAVEADSSHAGSFVFDTKIQQQELLQSNQQLHVQKCQIDILQPEQKRRQSQEQQLSNADDQQRITEPRVPEEHRIGTNVAVPANSLENTILGDPNHLESETLVLDGDSTSIGFVNGGDPIEHKPPGPLQEKRSACVDVKANCDVVNDADTGYHKPNVSFATASTRLGSVTYSRSEDNQEISTETVRSNMTEANMTPCHIALDSPSIVSVDLSADSSEIRLKSLAYLGSAGDDQVIVTTREPACELQQDITCSGTTESKNGVALSSERVSKNGCHFRTGEPCHEFSVRVSEGKRRLVSSAALRTTSISPSDQSFCITRSTGQHSHHFPYAQNNDRTTLAIATTDCFRTQHESNEHVIPIETMVPPDTSCVDRGDSTESTVTETEPKAASASIESAASNRNHTSLPPVLSSKTVVTAITATNSAKRIVRQKQVIVKCLLAGSSGDEGNGDCEHAANDDASFDVENTSVGTISNQEFSLQSHGVSDVPSIIKFEEASSLLPKIESPPPVTDNDASICRRLLLAPPSSGMTATDKSFHEKQKDSHRLPLFQQSQHGEQHQLQRSPQQQTLYSSINQQSDDADKPADYMLDAPDVKCVIRSHSLDVTGDNIVPPASSAHGTPATTSSLSGTTAESVLAITASSAHLSNASLTDSTTTHEHQQQAPPLKKLKPKPSPLCITQTPFDPSVETDASVLVSAGTSAEGGAGTTTTPATGLNSPTPYQSLLRSPLLTTTPHSPPPYTPPPMLSPCRKATGLFASIEQNAKGWSFGPSADAIASDVVPHVNIGPQYQAAIPAPALPSQPLCITRSIEVKHEDPASSDGDTNASCSLLSGKICTARESATGLLYGAANAFAADRSNDIEPSERADLLWKPEFAEHLSDSQLEQYISVACSSLVSCGGGGRNHELAYHILALCRGDLDAAVQVLLRGKRGFALPALHPLLTYKYQESDSWSSKQMDAFQTALLAHDKDFSVIADKVTGKDVKACIEMYYFWKKVCPDEYRRLRQARKRKSSVVTDTGERCESCLRCACRGTGCVQCADCCAHDRALAGSSDDRESRCTPHFFPCRVCGRVFEKVKSRNAHMKRHSSPSRQQPAQQQHRWSLTGGSSTSGATAGIGPSDASSCFGTSFTF